MKKSFNDRCLEAIGWYQASREGRPSPCRFTPSCSNYAHDAFSTYGPARGFWLTLRRLLRCRPFGPSGWDPIPEPHHSHQSIGSSDQFSPLQDIGK